MAYIICVLHTSLISPSHSFHCVFSSWSVSNLSSPFLARVLCIYYFYLFFPWLVPSLLLGVTYKMT